jgi:hypothetical protein
MGRRGDGDPWEYEYDEGESEVSDTTEHTIKRKNMLYSMDFMDFYKSYFSVIGWCGFIWPIGCHSV